MTHHDPLTIAREALAKIKRRLANEQRYRSDKALQPHADRCHGEVAEFTAEMVDMADAALAALTQASTHSEEGRE